MARIFAALVLLLALAGPVAAKAQASVTGPDGASFGETHGIAFDTGKAPVAADRWWALVECYQWGQKVYAESLYLGPVPRTGTDALMTLGPTSLWPGGAADCTVTLLAYTGGGLHPYASDTFTVGP